MFWWSCKWVSRLFKRSWIGVWGSFQGVSRMLQGSLRGVLRDILGWFKGASRYLKEVQKLFLGCFKDVLGKFLWCLKNASSVFQKSFIKSFKYVSRIFKWSFFCNFVAWISSQLPEQKEGLLTAWAVQRLLKSQIHRLTDWQRTPSFVWLSITLYDFVWLYMTMYE